MFSQRTPPRCENFKSPSAAAPPAAPNSSLSCRSALFFAQSVSDGKRRGGKRLSNPFFLAPSCVGVMALPMASSYPPLPPSPSHSPGLIKGTGRKGEHQAKRGSERARERASPRSTQMDPGRQNKSELSLQTRLTTFPPRRTNAAPSRRVHVRRSK